MLFFLTSNISRSPLTLLVTAIDEAHARRVVSKECKDVHWLDHKKALCWPVADTGTGHILMDSGEAYDYDEDHNPLRTLNEVKHRL